MKINKISPYNHKHLQIIDTIDKSPKNLYFIGKLPTSRRPTVAVVGSRRLTTYGKEVTNGLLFCHKN